LKISQRLQCIADIITHSSLKEAVPRELSDSTVEHRAEPYQHIWDCCCDHGHLGMLLLTEKTAAQVHFVDIIPSIMLNLQQRLIKHFPICDAQTRCAWQLHTIDVLDLPLETIDKQQTHLIVIAGVGGEQTLHMVQELSHKYSGFKLEFLLCPVRHQYKLRLGLKPFGLTVLNEKLVQENKRYYEIIHLANAQCNASDVREIVTDTAINSMSSISTTPLIPCGSLLWQPFDKQAKNYLQQTIEHCEKLLRGHNQQSAQYQRHLVMLADYQAVHKLTK
jgi:tRNA (adenine22-N1)-methyltransferase